MTHAAVCALISISREFGIAFAATALKASAAPVCLICANE
jgi:hypothetical protein